MAWRIARRLLSGRSKPGSKSYIDEWHASTVKPDSFYEEHAARGVRQKKYFYSVDLQGRVFLEETLPKNLATSIKNVQFLDFFFRQMRKLKDSETDILKSLHVDGDYPFVSPCGLELNFVRPADTVIVFHTLELGVDSVKQDFESLSLGFGGSLTQPFHPQKLVTSKRTGRLYHELSTSQQFSPDDKKLGETSDDTSASRKASKAKRLTRLHDLRVPEYGLIRSSVAVALSENITFCSDREPTLSHSDMDFVAGTEQYPIPWLPEYAEPGPWSMPVLEGEEIIEQ